MEPPPGSIRNFILRHHRVLYLSLLAVAIGTIIAVTLLIEKPEDPEDYIQSSGYLGVFLMAVIGSSSPVWPLPGSWA